MLAHIKRDDLLRLSKQAALAVPRNTTIKELQGIHLEADEGNSMLTLTATNLEITIRASMGAVVERPGNTVIDARLLTDIVSKLSKDSDLDMELERGGQLAIRSGHTHYLLNVLSGDKYPMPELPFPDDTIPVTGVQSLVRKTAFAAADGENAPLMSCIKISLGPDGLRGVSTNGFCIMEAKGDENCKGATELLIPAHSLAALAAISRDSDVYEMGLAGKSIVFWNGELLFSARLMEGKYPNTKILFDSFQAKYSVNLSAEELASAVLSASVVAPENSRIEVAFGEHAIRVSAGEDRERATVPVKALVLSAPGQPFYYNYKTLLQYLRLVKGKVTLDFDERGLLAIRAGATQYIQSPLRAPKQAAQSQKAA